MKKLLLWIALFALLSLACGIQTELPQKQTNAVSLLEKVNPPGYWATVTGSVNIRACPDYECEDLDEFTAGEVVYVKAVEGRWCETAWGWSVCQYLEER